MELESWFRQCYVKFLYVAMVLCIRNLLYDLSYTNLINNKFFAGFRSFDNFSNVSLRDVRETRFFRNLLINFTSVLSTSHQRVLDYFSR